MSNHISATTGSASLPTDVLAGIEEKLSSSVIGKILQEYSIGDIKLSMWIPSDLAGKVIGKKGIVIQNIQRETKAKIINALPRVGDSLWIAVVIIGEVKPVFDACKSISEIVDGEVDDVVFEFTINYRKPFFLYGGRKFGIIKKISADTNVRIFFPEFNPKEQPFKDALPVTLEGTGTAVRRAVGLFEKEALIYQYQQSVRAERHETNSNSSGDSARREVKTGRRVLTTGTAPAPALAPSREPTIRATAAETTDAAESTKPTKAANGKEKVAKGDARTQAAPKAGAAEPSPPKAGVTQVTSATAPSVAHDAGDAQQGDATAPADESATDPVAVTKPAGRQVEKFINVPTTLVGLLLSKRPKAKSTTINQIQVMTHTIISKMLPVGFEAAADASPHASAESGSSGEAAQGGALSEATTPLEGAKMDGAEDGASEGSESSGDGDSSEGEGSDAEEDAEGEGRTDVADSAAATDGGTSICATTDVPDSTEGTDEPKEAPVKTAAEQAEDEAKRRAIAESERLGYVVFRVLGYHDQNVDTVLQALKEIIAGERISQVCEKLKTTALSLPWPPNRQPPKWLRTPGDAREPKVRKERLVKVRDPLRPKSTRLRRSDGDDEGEAASGAPPGEGEVTGVTGVSSRYKGKNPRPREQLLSERAAAGAEGGAAAGATHTTKRGPARGPPREPRARPTRGPVPESVGETEAAPA